MPTRSQNLQRYPRIIKESGEAQLLVQKIESQLTIILSRLKGWHRKMLLNNNRNKRNCAVSV